MANHKSAKKRIRTNARKHAINQAAASKLKTLVKKVKSTTDKEKAEAYLKEAVAQLDKNAARNRIHKNTAARRKSKLTKYVNSL